jgi:voltage-gated potassium channel Kch
LELEVEGHPVTVVGYGDLVVVEASSLRAAVALLRGATTLPVAEVGPSLRHADVTVDVRVRGVSVARLGPEVDGGLLGRAFGVPDAALSVGGVGLAGLRWLTRLRRD